MDLVKRLECASGLIGFLTDNSQERIVKVLTKIFEEKGTKIGIDECAATMRSLAKQIYDARKNITSQST